MGCSNARLLVQAPLAGEPGVGTNNTLSPAAGATSSINTTTDTNNTTTRMHLTGVDLIVERNGSYTLLLTPKTHKQLMPYVLRKKRFRILVDKPCSDSTNEPLMEGNKEFKNKSKQAMESAIESIEEVASDELNKAKDRFIGGRSIDRGNPEDEDENIQSDDEGMIEEIVTTIEEDKDLECKVKKKVETKKTVAEDPETHNKIIKVVKTEVTEITRTITINDQHDLARAKRELGIDDVNRFLPLSTSWIDQPHVIHLKEKRYEPFNEIVTSKDFPSDSPVKQSVISIADKPVLSEATSVGRGPVIETISPSSRPPSTEVKPKKKKKKSKLCSCTRAADDEPQPILILPEEKKSTVTTSPVNNNNKSVLDTQIQGQQLISSDMKQLIVDKKVLLIIYIHSKIFLPSKLFTTKEQDAKGRKLSSRILDLLRYDRCSSWTQMSEQLTDEYAEQLPGNLFIQPMVNTYENLFISKQSNLVNTFATIHNENDIKYSPENYDYITVVQSVINERDNQPNIGIIAKQSVENMEDTLERLQTHVQQEEVEIHDEKVIDVDDQSMKEMNLTDDIPQSQSIYNEEQLIKMLADISQHRPITLAEAIAYEYIDIEDPKLGLSTDTSQRIKNLFRPLSDETTSNLIRVKRSGEYLTDVNLNETNPFEKLNSTEPLIYQLQQTFEPTLDFNEKQFRLLTETILNNKEQYDQLQFDIARTTLPLYDLKESSVNDFSQSDSGYSMTTATHESLASKIKIEFEPIQQDIPPYPPKRNDLDEDEKVDLDKATAEQLDKYELNHELIQIIKTDFNGSDKTIGQAILSRELRLDSTEPNDVARLNSLGIQKEQARILSSFFFPKQTRIIAYSPEPGRFVEAQTTYNPDYPGYKTDTTIIQIQEKQLSSDHHAMQRNIYDVRTSPILSRQIIESETIIPSPSQEIVPVVVTKEKPITSPPPPPSPSAPIKKRKSSGSGGLLSCFKSKKPKAGTEQQGQSTILPPAQLTTQTSIPNQTMKLNEEKPMVDYAILPDGKRIYIDVFRDRPGLDMSYKPNDFDQRFVLPIVKPESEYERPLTPETESFFTKSETPVSIPSEIIEQESIVHHEPPEKIEHKPIIHHYEPRPATIEPVDVPLEQKPSVIPLRKSEEAIISKKKSTFDLHGAAVSLPEVKLVTPGPLPTLSLTKETQSKKVKTSTGGLCASCFGKKSAEKKKKEVKSESIQAPIELKKNLEEEKKEDLTPTTIVTTPPVLQSLPSTTTDEPILPRVNIDQFKERNFEKSAESHPKPQERLEATIEKVIPVVEPHYQIPISQPVPQALTLTTQNISVFTGVNIDQFKERTFEKSPERLPKSEERLDTVVQKAVPTEVPHYQLPTKEPISPSLPTAAVIGTSVFAGVNIDQFKERTFEKSPERLPKSEERLDTVVQKAVPTEVPHYQLPTKEPISPSLPTAAVIGTSVFAGVNIDQFKERNFDKSAESLPKPQERLEATIEKITPIVEPHYQVPIKEPVLSSLPTTPVIESSPLASTEKNVAVVTKVNIDQFKERTFKKSPQKLPKSEEHLDARSEQVVPTEGLHYQLPISEPVSPSSPTTKVIESPPLTLPIRDTSVIAGVNIDQFKERTFEKSAESLPKPQERLEETIEKIIPVVEPQYQLPTKELVSLPTTKTIESPPLSSTEKNASVVTKVNIDQFKERTFEKSPEKLPKSEERLETIVQKAVPTEEPHYQIPIKEPVSPSSPTAKSIESLPLTSPTRDTSVFAGVNIDQFKERTFEKSPERLPKSEGRIDTIVQKAAPTEEPHYQIPIKEPVSPSSPTAKSIESLPLTSPTRDTSVFAGVNIDQFKERTFEKSPERLPKSEGRIDTIVQKAAPTEEPHYQIPIKEPVSPSSPTTKSIESPPLTSPIRDTSVFAGVNIDQFKERTFEKGVQNLPKPQERLEATIEKIMPIVEPHYQLPINEPVPPPLPTKTINESPPLHSPTQDTSIFSRINIDQFKERTFEKSTEKLRKSEEPLYQLRSVEHEYSIPERTGLQNNTYDIPRSIKLQPTTSSTVSKTDGKIMLSSAATDAQKSSGDFIPIKTEVNQKTRSKKKKSGLFSSFFRPNEQKSKVPALDLPSINNDLSPNNQLRQPHRRESDPLRVPNSDLPKLDLPLPTYNRPEVNMTIGQVKQSSEFSIPIVEFSAIPNLNLPENDKQPIQSHIDLMKIPHVELPELRYTSPEEETVRLPQIALKTKFEEEIPKVPTIETGLALASPVDDLLSIQTDHKNFPIETDYAVKNQSLIPDDTDSFITPIEQKYTTTDTHVVQSFIIDKKIPKLPDFTPLEPVLTLPKEPIASLPIKKKSSTLALSSCFGNKSNVAKEKKQIIAIPRTSLPKIEMPIPSSNISSTLKTKGSLRAPGNNLPSVDLTPTSRLLTNETEASVPNVLEIKKEKQPIEEEIKVRLPTPPPLVVEKQPIKVKSETSPSIVKTLQSESKKSPLFEIKAPVMNIPQVDLSGPLKSDAYVSYSKPEETTSIAEPIPSRSDSGLEAIISSHIHPSSTFGTNTTIEDFQQHPSISSGLGSEILDSMTTKGYTLSDMQVVTKQENKNLLKYDFTRKITMNDEILKSNENFDSKKDQKSYEKIRLHAIDLIKDKKVSTYSELQEKLIIEHKNEAFIVEPVVRSLYHTIEKPDFDRSESPLAIRDMACLPAKQTYDTVTHLDREAAPLTTTQMTKETSSVSTSSQLPTTLEKESSDQTPIPIDAARSCLTCGRSKSKTKLPPSVSTTSNTGLLDDRRRTQIHSHRNELGNVLRDHIQSIQPPIRQFPEHPKEIDKIIRKGLTLVTQPKILSYEQLRNDLKLENKQTFYLIDPIVDIIRDTNDHCDITQMNEKINLDILDSNISQTATLYNNQTNLLTIEEYHNLKANNLSWLNEHLINNETKEKKLTKKQIKELNKILHRTLDILSLNGVYSWEELTLQLQREYPKANDLCNRSIELLKQGQKDGLLLLQQVPQDDGKRRASSLITDRAKQNLKMNRSKVILSLKNLLINHNKSLHDEKQLNVYLNKTFYYLEEQKTGQFKNYNDLKEHLKKEFKNNQEDLIEQIVDVVEQAHASNQFDDIDKIEVQTLMKDRLDGKPLIIKEMYVSLPPRTGAYGSSKHDDTSSCLTTAINGDRTFNNGTSSQRVGRGLSWREANERARILFYRGKHPAIHYDEQAAAFDVRMLLETASGGTQEIPVTDSDVHELLNSCGVQWDGVNLISLVDHSEDVVRAAEKAALKVIREKGIVELRTPPSTPAVDNHDESVTSSAATS